MTTAKQCAELGGTCPVPSVVVERDGVSRCLSHATDPLRIRRRDERNRKGGLARLRTLPATTAAPDLSSLDSMRRGLESVMHAMVTGQLDARIGRAVIDGYRVGAALGSLELQGLISDLERRIGLRGPGVGA